MSPFVKAQEMFPLLSASPRHRRGEAPWAEELCPAYKSHADPVAGALEFGVCMKQNLLVYSF